MGWNVRWQPHHQRYSQMILHHVIFLKLIIDLLIWFLLRNPSPCLWLSLYICRHQAYYLQSRHIIKFDSSLRCRLHSSCQSCILVPSPIHTLASLSKISTIELNYYPCPAYFYCQMSAFIAEVWLSFIAKCQHLLLKFGLLLFTNILKVCVHLFL